MYDLNVICTNISTKMQTYIGFLKINVHQMRIFFNVNSTHIIMPWEV